MNKSISHVNQQIPMGHESELMSQINTVISSANAANENLILGMNNISNMNMAAQRNNYMLPQNIINHRQKLNQQQNMIMTDPNMIKQVSRF